MCATLCISMSSPRTKGAKIPIIISHNSTSPDLGVFAYISNISTVKTIAIEVIFLSNCMKLGQEDRQTLSLEYIYRKIIKRSQSGERAGQGVGRPLPI